MRKITLFIALFIFSMTNVLGQNDSDSEILSNIVVAMADELCSCASEKAKEKTLTEVDLGSCMLSELGKYSDQLEDLGFMISDEESMTKLGEMIGVKAAFKCPEIFESFIEEEMNEEEVSEEEEVIYRGVIKKIEISDFVKIYIQVEGRIETYLWLTEVDTNINIYDSFENLKSRKVEFTIYEASIYDPRISEYRDFNIFNSFIVKQ